MVKGHGGKVKKDVSSVSTNLQVQVLMQTLDCKAHDRDMDFGVLGSEYEPRLVIVVK
jgi:hypothetical protein